MLGAAATLTRTYTTCHMLHLGRFMRLPTMPWSSPTSISEIQAPLTQRSRNHFKPYMHRYAPTLQSVQLDGDFQKFSALLFLLWPDPRRNVRRAFDPLV